MDRTIDIKVEALPEDTTEITVTVSEHIVNLDGSPGTLTKSSDF